MPQKPQGRPRSQDIRSLNVDIPAELDLHRRGALLKIATGQSIKEQVAIAYDEWLTRHGYPRPAKRDQSKAKSPDGA